MRPSLLKVVNDVYYYECPKGGDENPVIAVDHEYGVADYTVFYDVGDFYPSSEYNYYYKNGRVTNDLEEGV